MSVIKPTHVMTDRRGMDWRPAPGYQDQEANRPGWLLLRSANGEELEFGDVVHRYGIPGEGGVPYLRGHDEGWHWESDGKGGGVSAPRCQESTCPDFGSYDFGEGTCPAEHAVDRLAAQNDTEDS
jgi:hypothetical protein